MILCDSNVWLALTLSTHSHHAATLRWMETVVEEASICFCRATQQSFLRLLTNATVLATYDIPPLTNAQAWTTYESLLSDDRVVTQFREPPGVELHWKQLAERSTPSPKLWMDAYLAAFALAGGYRFVTTDRAFAQFDGLDLILLGPSD